LTSFQDNLHNIFCSIQSLILRHDELTHIVVLIELYDSQIF